MIRCYCIIRSAGILPTALKAAISGLRSRYAGLHLDAWTKNKLDGIELVGNRLRNLTAFQSAYSVAVRAGALGTEGISELEQLVHLCDAVKGSAAGIIWTVLQRPRAVHQDGRFWNDSDLSLSAGLGAEGYLVSLRISSDSPLYKDNLSRRELFRNTIVFWGLQDHMEVESRNGDFEITAKPPLKLRYLHIPRDNLNPTDLCVEGLSSLDISTKAARAARDSLAKQVLSTTFGCSLTREQYEQVYEKFNALWKGWNIEVQGTITAEAESILNGGEFTEESPKWIPAMRWCEDDVNAVILVSVIIEDGQRYLEVATDGGTLDLLKERVAFLKDIRFEPIFP